MKKCKFNLKFKNKNLEFNSEYALNTFLERHYDILSAGRDITDIEYSKVMNDEESTPTQKTLTKLLNISKKGPEIKTTITDMGEKQVEPKNKNYKSVLAYLNEVARSGETKGLIYFDIENYKESKKDFIIKQLQLNSPEGIENFQALSLEYAKIKSENKRGLISNEEFNSRVSILAESTIIKDLENWKKLAGIGTNIHKLAEVYFNHRLSPSDETFTTAMFPADIRDLGHQGKVNYLDFLKSLETSIRAKHGQDCVILPEYKVYDESSKLVGVIDLLVIDSDGKANVYDYKTSYKDPQSWNSGKVTTFKYQLGTYANMLRNKGINVRGKFIVPLVMNDIDFDRETISSVTPYKIAEIADSDMSPQMIYNINQIVKVDNSAFYESQSASTNVTEQLKTAWGYNIKMKTSKSNVDDFILNNVKTDIKDATKKAFYDVSQGKYIAVDPDKVREEVEDYFKRESENAISLLVGFKDRLHGIMANSANTFEDFTIGSRPEDRRRKEVLVRSFGKYVGGDWTLVMDDHTLDSLGLLMFINQNTRAVEFVSYTVNNLDSPVKLSVGSSILGNFTSDAIAETEPDILAATNGNIELLKTFFYINDNIDSFKSRGYNLGRIMAFNPISSKFHTQELSKLQFNFDYITKKMKLDNNTINLPTADKYQLLLSRLTALMSEDSLMDKSNDRVSRFITVMTDKRDSGRLMALLEMEKELRYILIDKGVINDIKKFDSQEKQLYGMVNDAILYERKIPLTFEQDISQFVANATNPTSMPSKNLLNLVEVTKGAMQHIRGRQQEFKHESQPIIDDFLDAQGYTQTRRRALGDQARAYTNLFIVDETTGKMDPRMILKDPYDNNSHLTPKEREFLTYFLKEINKVRFGTTDLHSDMAIQKRESQEWFHLPLLRASAVSKLIDKNYGESVKEAWDGLLNVNNLFDKETPELDKYSAGMFEMFNTFEFHGSIDSRNALIQEEKAGAFETNLETVLDTFVFSYIRQEEYNKALPIVNAIKIAMSWQAFELNIEIPNSQEFIKKYIQSAIYSDANIPSGIKTVYQTVSAIKNVASIANIGLNPITGVMAMFQGQWGNITRLMSRTYGKNMFTKEDYLFAMNYMRKDCVDSMAALTIAEGLNELYGLNNMDVNKLPEMMTKNRGGLLGFKSGGLYWTSSAPDYFNRMTIFISQMKHDGCFEAHSIVKGRLVYDFTKDKRFNIFAAGDTRNPEYGKQKGLYLAMRADFNKAGANLSETDPLPQAYTLRQRESLKMFSDSIHGYYDHETKIMYNNTILGMMFLQFKRWITSKKDQYILEPGTYAQGDYFQLEVDGIKYYVDGDGNQTTTNTGQPIMIWKGKYMEGIFISLANMLTEIKNSENKVETFFNLLKDRPERTANLKLLAWDMGIVMVLALIFDLIDWPSMKENSEYASALSRAVLRSGNDLNVFSVVGSGFSAEPFAALSYGKDVKDSFLKTLSGDESVGRALTSNIGVFRPLAPLLK